MTAQINMRSMGASPQNGSETTLTPKRSGQSSGTDNSRAPVMKGRITAVLSLTSSSLLLTTLSERGRAAIRSHYGPPRMAHLVHFAWYAHPWFRPHPLVHREVRKHAVR